MELKIQAKYFQTVIKFKTWHFSVKILVFDNLKKLGFNTFEFYIIFIILTLFISEEIKKPEVSKIALEDLLKLFLEKNTIWKESVKTNFNTFFNLFNLVQRKDYAYLKLIRDQGTNLDQANFEGLNTYKKLDFQEYLEVSKVFKKIVGELEPKFEAKVEKQNLKVQSHSVFERNESIKGMGEFLVKLPVNPKSRIAPMQIRFDPMLGTTQIGFIYVNKGDLFAGKSRREFKYYTVHISKNSVWCSETEFFNELLEGGIFDSYVHNHSM